MVVWEDWLSAVADALLVNQTQAGGIVSFVTTIFTVIGILLITDGEKAEWTVPLVFFFMSVFFTYLGWYNQVMGSVMSFIIASFIGLRIAQGLSDNNG